MNMRPVEQEIGFLLDKFDKDFFRDRNESTTNQIRTDVDLFNSTYPDLYRDFLAWVKIRFRDSHLEDWSHLFNGDRCHRLLVEIDSELRFICQISIYNFFSVYQHSIKREGDKYAYGDLNFIQPSESGICDEIYEILKQAGGTNFIWLDRSILHSPIQKLSIFNQEERFAHVVTVADLLFTDHYL
jgi:hypothetical protein